MAGDAGGRTPEPWATRPAMRQSGRVEIGAAAGEEVVVRVDFLVAGFQRINLDDGQRLLIRLRALEYLPLRRDDLAIANIGQALLPAELLPAGPVARHREHVVFET